ncbi:MAG: MFS transporter [Paracoccaceae bacterium]
MQSPMPAAHVTTDPDRWLHLRLVIGIGLTQIIGFGTIFYAFGSVVPALSADLGISPGTAFAAFSLALLAGALAAPTAGRLVDQHGARAVMSTGSVLAALALTALSQAQGLVTLALALIAVEVTATLILYDAAFAALAQALGPARARRAITHMTLLGGFASTIFWPLTQAILTHADWRTAYLIFAALNLLICLPLHLTLTRAPDLEPVAGAPAAAPPQFAPLPAAQHPRAMLWVAIAFAVAGLVFSALSASWVTTLTAFGLPAAAAVTAGTMMGPAQVGVRILDMLFGLRLHPLTTTMISTLLLIVALAVLWTTGPTLTGAMVFAVLFGLAQGLTSIVRGTVPLVLFGAHGFAARLGKLAAVRMVMAAIAPFGIALIIETWSASAALLAMLCLAVLGAMALKMIPR